MSETRLDSPVRDLEAEARFDFLEGEWDLHCRFPLSNGTWGEGPGTLRATRILGGTCFLEFFEGPYLGGQIIQGVGLRAFNRATGYWEHTWTDSRAPGGFPVWRGRWEDGHIHIVSEWDDESGRHVISRLTWSNVTAHTAHWDSHRSLDGGKTWEKHWEMDLRKRSPR